MILGYVTYTYFLRDGCIALFAKASVLFRSASIPPRPGLFTIPTPSNQSLSTLPPCRVRTRTDKLDSTCCYDWCCGLVCADFAEVLKTLAYPLAKTCVYDHSCKYLFTPFQCVRAGRVLPIILRLIN